jgi:hypothetical protein
VRRCPDAQHNASHCIRSGSACLFSARAGGQKLAEMVKVSSSTHFIVYKTLYHTFFRQVLVWDGEGEAAGCNEMEGHTQALRRKAARPSG